MKLKFIKVDINNQEYINALKKVAESSTFLGNVHNYNFLSNEYDFFGNDYLVSIDDNAVGYLGISSIVETFTEVGNTVTIYYGIGKEYYGNGYGKKILEATIEELTNSEVNTIFAFVDVDNTHGLMTIEKANFETFINYDDEIQYCYKLKKSTNLCFFLL